MSATQEEKPRANLKEDFVNRCEQELGEKLRCVLLYGSRARGSAGKNSDWDFFVVAEGLPQRRIERYRLFQEIEDEMYDKYDQQVQVEAYKPGEAKASPPNPLIYGILTSYEVLYGPDYWKEIRQKLKAEIEDRKPVLYGKDKKWRIAKLV